MECWLHYWAARLDSFQKIKIITEIDDITFNRED